MLPPRPPGRQTPGQPPGRNLKKTLLKHKNAVNPLFYAPETTDLIYNEAIKSIHTKAVGDAISSYEPSKVLS